MNKSQFEGEISGIVRKLSNLRMALKWEESDIGYENIPEIIYDMNIIDESLDVLQDFVLKYTDFLEMLRRKFGIETIDCTYVGKTVTGARKLTREIRLMLAGKKFNFVRDASKDLHEFIKNLEMNFGVIVTIPEEIPYEKLSHGDWRMIGIAGVHYKSKVFLSYPYRDKDPEKDENEKIIKYYIEPILTLLNIEPVTARGELKPEDRKDDKIYALIDDCDGIIGFYTKEDELSNVIHELARSRNIIARFVEEGTRPPSMEDIRWHLWFKRTHIGELLIDLVKALKNKNLYRLVSS